MADFRVKTIAHRWLLAAAGCFVVGFSGPTAVSQVLSPELLPPVSWFERYMPENLTALKYPEYADGLDKAQMQISRGRYRLALQTLGGMTQGDTARRLLLTAEALRRSGRYGEAVRSLAGKEARNSPEMVVLLGETLAEGGARSDAIKLLADSVSQFPDNARVRLAYVSVLESTGQLAKARAALAWFGEQRYVDRWRSGELEQIESADQLVTIARGIDRLAVLTGRYRDDLRLHQDVLAMFVRAYDVLDRRNADAHVQAAEFYKNHDDDKAAADELGRALTINPNHLGALKLQGEVALANYDFDSCEKAIASIRKVNADDPAARLLSAELLLLQRMPEEARKALMPLIKADPNSAELLAHLAACEALTFDSGRLASVLAEIDQKMPESSLAHTTAAAYLIPAFQFKDAAALLQVAIERTPHWNTPRNLLALAYMQQTDMEKARPVLEDARKLDPFNIETTNYLRLLDTLDSYKLEQSDHFAVRYSPTDDPFLASEVLAYMEEQYGRITREYAHETPERTVIELMPTTEDFAVRTTGKPWIGTIGASTGPVITMVAPRSFGKTNGAFDWCDVARHEFVHTVTLDATHHRIPRWFTEGLAVSEQTDPLNYEQAQRLSSAVLKGKLFPIRRLNWAFVRPQRKGDQPLAYAQSLWLCTYIEENFTHKKILEMFDGYRTGLSTEQVVSKCLGMSTIELDDRFAKWAADQVVKTGFDNLSQKQLAELKKSGEQLIAAKDYKGALEVWQKAYSVCAADPLVNQRLAGLYLQKSINQPLKAAVHLHALDREQLKDNRYAVRLAKLYQQQGDLNKAVLSGRRATEIDPYDSAARELLAGICKQAGMQQQAEAQTQIAATISSLKDQQKQQ